jgi:hypothetical protein
MFQHKTRSLLVLSCCTPHGTTVQPGNVLNEANCSLGGCAESLLLCWGERVGWQRCAPVLAAIPVIGFPFAGQGLVFSNFELNSSSETTKPNWVRALNASVHPKGQSQLVSSFNDCSRLEA